MPEIQVIAGDRDLTALHQGLQLSNVDPGGMETLQMNPQLIKGLRPGAPVWVRLGSRVMGHYRVNEPGQHDKGGVSEFSVAALGYGAALKDNPIQRLYVHRDLSAWAAGSTQRQINNLNAGQDMGGPSTANDDATGAPSIKTELVGAWTRLAGAEAQFTPGGGLAIASLYYAWKLGAGVSAADANWIWNVYLSTDDTMGSFDSSGTLRAAGPGSGTLVAAAGRTSALAQFYYSTAGGGAGVKYALFWTVLAAYGDYGLTKRGTASFTDAQGFYTYRHRGRRRGLLRAALRGQDRRRARLRRLAQRLPGPHRARGDHHRHVQARGLALGRVGAHEHVLRHPHLPLRGAAQRGHLRGQPARVR